MSLPFKFGHSFPFKLSHGIFAKGLMIQDVHSWPYCRCKVCVEHKMYLDMIIALSKLQRPKLATLVLIVEYVFQEKENNLFWEKHLKCHTWILQLLILPLLM